MFMLFRHDHGGGDGGGGEFMIGIFTIAKESRRAV
jgi:hypothetical protein